MNSLLLTLVIGLWVVVLLLGVMVYALARQIGVLHERIKPAGALMINQQVKAGDAAPALRAQTLAGGIAPIGGAAERSQLLFFLSPTCPVCKTLLPALAASSASESDWLDVYYVSDGADDHAGFALKHRLPKDRYIVSEEVGRAFGVAKLPYAVLLDAEGKVASLGLVNSREHLESLFNAKESGLVSIQDYFARRNAKDDNAALGA